MALTEQCGGREEGDEGSTPTTSVRVAVQEMEKRTRNYTLEIEKFLLKVKHCKKHYKTVRLV